MLYFFTVFIIFIMFLIFQRDQHASAKYLLGTVLLYALAILSMIFYLSKDIRYYNIIENYFLMPKSIWQTFMFFPVSKDTILRCMNLFSLLTILFGCLFSMNYMNTATSPCVKKFRKAVVHFLILEYFIYDPFLQKMIYLFFYPHLMNSQQFSLFLRITHFFTAALNDFIVVASTLNLFRANRQIYAFPHFKSFAYGETISYTLIMISYLALFGHLPNYMIRFSIVSGYTTYKSLPLYEHVRLYTLIPYYLFFASVLMCVCSIALAKLNRKMNQADFTISGQIDAVNTSSKAFCHYMKNELLAIEAEAQLLDVSEENQEDLSHLIERCQNLYSRIDKLHRSTKLAQLTMEQTDLEKLIAKMLERMSPELKEYKVSVKSSGSIPKALVDPNHFEQAVHNIVINALDAWPPLPPERKNLNFTFRSIDNWIALSVTDTGPGIPEKNLPHIFEPFFSSQPIAAHWGIGMTMTYQIIKAHNGKITVESKEGKGTTFRILLPNLKKMLP